MKKIFTTLFTVVSSTCLFGQLEFTFDDDTYWYRNAVQGHTDSCVAQAPFIYNDYLEDCSGPVSKSESLKPLPATDRFGNQDALEFGRFPVTFYSSLCSMASSLQNRQVSIKGSTNLFTPDYTYSLWIKLNSNTAKQYIMSIGGYGGDQSIWIDPVQGDIKLASYLYDGNPDVNSNFRTTLFAGTPIPSLNTWHHIVVVRRETSNSNSSLVAFYLNGDLKYSYTDNYNIYTYYGENIAKIGSRYDGTFPYLGYLDDLKIYNYALNSTQVTELYNADLVSSFNKQKYLDTEVKLYPNPAQSYLTIEGEQLDKMELRDALGTLVKTKSLQNNIETLSLSDLAPGLYTAKVFSGEAFTCKKIQIQ
ncbi:MAG: T9SS type A sorting domain-containing protein [Cytophagaceae bacterium]|jgi:hypothetical protein|nr:T9SS type A sorting domain-containing protein [Cytophagaceae bacterium]